MPASLTLPPLDVQILDIIRTSCLEGHASISGANVARYGFEQYGLDWAAFGHGKYCSGGHENYPLINLALGRLRKRGLIHRSDPEYVSPGYTWGLWSLTLKAKLMLKVDSTLISPSYGSFPYGSPLDPPEPGLAATVGPIPAFAGEYVVGSAF